MRKTTVSLSPIGSKRGSVLLAAVVAIIILSLVSASVLQWGQYTLRETRRKERIDKARIAAGNELEFLFYNWANEVDLPSSKTVQHRLQNTVIDGSPLAKVPAMIDTATGTPASILVDEDETSALPVTIARSIVALDTSGVGIVKTSGNLEKTGAVGYYNARVHVVMADPLFGQIHVRIGRRFTFQKASPFNFAVFYNGNLELNPSGTMVIGGDVQCNNSVFIGTKAGTGSSVTVTGKIFYYDQFNGDADPMLGSKGHAYKPAIDYDAPIFNPDPFGSGGAPDQTVARGEQVFKMKEKDSFVANMDPADIYNTYATASPKPYASQNDVMRSIIAPPPRDSYGNLVSESPVVAANRMYNKAAIRMEVKDSGGSPQAFFYDKAGNDITSKFSGVVNSSAIRTSVKDAREDKIVSITTVDVAALKTSIDADAALKDAYNGVVYMYDSAQSTDPSGRYGIRLSNAKDVPDFNEKGFVVASDNGIYIKGDFNNQHASLEDNARCAVLADAVTLLSDGWDDAKSAMPMMDDALPLTAKRKATTSITVNAALVSGNTPSVDGSSGNSGGVQNLVRYLEDWTDLSSTINGSIGQMFQAKYFNSYYKANGLTNQVYQNPKVRTLNFDRRLASKPPSGAPASIVRFYRGDLFTWTN